VSTKVTVVPTLMPADTAYWKPADGLGVKFTCLIIVSLHPLFEVAINLMSYNPEPGKSCEGF
jgi:hypothetical protein